MNRPVIGVVREKRAVWPAVKRGLQGHSVIGKAWAERLAAQFHTGSQP